MPVEHARRFAEILKKQGLDVRAVGAKVIVTPRGTEFNAFTKAHGTTTTALQAFKRERGITHALTAKGVIHVIFKK
ncbi:MAG: hypothetical protein NTY90_01440 [Candidatus Micrarchaeota archaeon]|nr:hypothetical protein [Candidatus Micrarchaeota archaeon]